MTKFKKGDNVRCLTDGYMHIKRGEVSIVEKVNDDGAIMLNDGKLYYYEKENFELVTLDKPAPDDVVTESHSATRMLSIEVVCNQVECEKGFMSFDNCQMCGRWSSWKEEE